MHQKENVPRMNARISVVGAEAKMADHVKFISVAFHQKSIC